MKKWVMRRERLLEELSKQGKLSIMEVQGFLDISESTARRLVVELEQENCLIRCFGGIQRIQPFAKGYTYAETEIENFAAKEQIGKYAANLVSNGDVIYLSGGSTVKYMALALCIRLKEDSLTNISVITNSLVAAEALTKYTNVIMPGGIYRKNLQVLDGSLAEKNLKTMCFTKAFLGVVAINEAEGFMTADIETNSIIEVVLSKASTYYVLADASKFGNHSFISYGKLKNAAGIITDSALPFTVKESLRDLGANILLS